MFPMTAETARVPNCLTLSIKFPKEPNKDERKGHGFDTKSIWVWFLSEIVQIGGTNYKQQQLVKWVRFQMMSQDLGLRRSLYNIIILIKLNNNNDEEDMMKNNNIYKRNGVGECLICKWKEIEINQFAFKASVP